MSSSENMYIPSWRLFHQVFFPPPTQEQEKKQKALLARKNSDLTSPSIGVSPHCCYVNVVEYASFSTPSAKIMIAIVEPTLIPVGVIE